MKTILWLALILGGLVMQVEANGPPYISTTYPHVVKSNSVTVTFEPSSETPEYLAVRVRDQEPEDARQAKWMENMEKWRMEFATNRNAKPKPMPPSPKENNYDSDRWVPFQTNLLVDLGPGTGRRSIVFGYQFKGRPFDGHWSGSFITIQGSATVLVITNPIAGVISQPMIQLQGYTTRDWGKPLTYQIFNQTGNLTATGEGLVNNKDYNLNTGSYTTTYFSCYDLTLNPGTNTIVLRGEDEAGYSFSTNLVFVFSTAGVTHPPVFSVDYPAPGGKIVDDSITIRGPSDNPTAKFVALISSKGQTNKLTAVVERNGYFWFDHVPLILGENQVKIMATDVAGNTSSTNFALYRSDEVRIHMDPVIPANQLWQRTIATVTGKVQPASRDVWINGVQATVKTDGTWLAKNVPVLSSPSGGTAFFNMTAIPPGDLANGKMKVNEQLSTQASLGTNAMVLNATAPACGVFHLHLTETAGRGFILEASTNLVEWTPILTNASPEPAFDYNDANANNYHCRFFRVMPLK